MPRNPLPLTTLVILILIGSMWVSPETARGQMLFSRGDCNTAGAVPYKHLTLPTRDQA